MHLNDLYFRLWVGYKICIISAGDGFKKQTKNGSSFKILFGIQGIEAGK